MAIISKCRSQARSVAFVLGIAGITFLTFYFALNCKSDRAFPSVFAGQWQIIGVDGEFRGTAELAADGSIDTRDDYTGVWTADDSDLHVVIWKKRPHGSNGNYATTPELQSLRIRQSPEGQIALSGEHVVLRRAADEHS